MIMAGIVALMTEEITVAYTETEDITRRDLITKTDTGGMTTDTGGMTTETGGMTTETGARTTETVARATSVVDMGINNLMNRIMDNIITIEIIIIIEYMFCNILMQSITY